MHDGLFFRPDAETFAACPPDTIDYAVMERIAGSDSHRRALVVPIDAGWSDVGSWAAIMDVSDKDENGNVIRGDVYTHEMRNSMIFGHHRLVAAVGLKDVIVVETPDAVLAADRNRVEDVRALVEQLKAEGRPERENHRRAHRPWGWYEVIDSGDRFQVKRISVNPGQALSLQMHHHRSEHWVVVSGTAKIVKDNGESLLFENESAYVKVGETHRLENPGTIPLEIIEVQSGSYLGEDDIVRFDDRYNRK
jgi:mannose-1-phosphate guanylyltransferase/mannose-6-phosphate isomerase